MSTRLLRTSERLSFKTCRFRWWWSYRDNLRPIGASNALRFGDLIHRALAPYYKKGRKRGPHPAKTFERLYHEQADELRDSGFNVYSDEKWEDALELGLAMLRGYVERFEGIDAEWEVVSSEQVFRVPLTSRMTGLPIDFVYVGTLDGIWRNLADDRLIFKEFKTATAIVFDGLALDEQAGGYWTFAPKWAVRKKLLKPGETVDHILYTYLRKARPDPDGHYDAEGRKLNKPSKAALTERYNGKSWWHPKLTVDEMIEKAGESAWQLGEVSKSQPAPYFARQPVYRDEEDRRQVYQRVVQEVADMLRCEEDPLMRYKNPGPLHMPNCRGCPFKDPCELHETGNDYNALIKAEYEVWNPYAEHELAERH